MLNLIRQMNYQTAKSELTTNGRKVFPIYSLKTFEQVGYVLEDKTVTFDGKAIYHLKADNGYEMGFIKGENLDRILEKNLNAYL